MWIALEPDHWRRLERIAHAFDQPMSVGKVLAIMIAGALRHAAAKARHDLGEEPS